jgi:4-amino-4-deoxy-L-arabinose transferase-like glycosyltransferase
MTEPQPIARAWPERAPLDAGARGRAILVLLLVGAALRVMAVLTVGNIDQPHGDEREFLSLGRGLARGDGYPDSHRPPGFPFFVSIVYRLFGPDPIAIRLAQVTLSLAVIVLIFDLADRRFGRAAAIVSGALAAAQPELIHYTHFLWSETLLTTLLLAAVWGLERFDRTPRWPSLVACGLLVAAAMLTREMVLFAVPGIAWWLWSKTRRRRSALVFVLVVSAGVFPWTFRNYLRHGRFVLVSTHRWSPMAEGNLLSLPDPVEGAKRARALHGRYFGDADEFSREAYAREVAIQAVLEQQPGWILKKIVFNTYLLLAPSRSQLHRFLQRGWLAPRWQRLVERLVPVEATLYAAFLVVGLPAFCLVPDARLKSLVVVIFGAFLFVYIVGNANHRFRVPFLPFLALYAGPLLCGRRDPSRHRMAGAITMILAVAAITLVDLLAPPIVLVRNY